MAPSAIRTAATVVAGMLAVLGVSLTAMRCGSRTYLRVSAPDGSLSQPTERLTADRVGRCAHLTSLVPSTTDNGWLPRKATSPNLPVFAGSFALATHPDNASLLALLYAGPSRFEASLVERFSENMNDAGSEATEMFRAQEQQRQQSESRKRLPDGREVVARLQGLGLGGKVRWATLEGEHGYALTAVIVLDASDSDLTAGERNAIGTLASDDNLASLLECVEHALWP
ncbi:MAG: hypothetical protein ABJB12_17220 [Pseudomonadota bacterium]